MFLDKSFLYYVIMLCKHVHIWFLCLDMIYIGLYYIGHVVQIRLFMR